MRDRASLGGLFAPRAIALVGMPGDLDRPGARPLHFLRRHGYTGDIHLVNPRRREIDGLPAYPSLAAVPGPVDVAWIGLPVVQAVEAVAECGRAGVPFAVVLGAGFAEAGEGGRAAQTRLHDAARAAGVRVVGPNTVGFVNAWDRVALTFSTIGEVDTLGEGPVAILSQSGGVGGCLFNRALDRELGIGLFVSTGNEADLGLADYLEWVVGDGRARSVACIVEQVREPERFAVAVRRAIAAGVPVVVRKLGASETGARAARSHTGSLVGEREAWRAWARATGVLEARDLDQLVEIAAYLARAPQLAGNRLAMVTSSGGIAVMLADALEPRGFWFASLGPGTLERVARLLPGYATVGNPLDVTAGLADETFGEVLGLVINDPGVDLVVVPLTLASAQDGRARAEQVVRVAQPGSKPVAVCWPGGSLVRDGVRVLQDARVPIFDSVTSCSAALLASLDYRRHRRRVLEGPSQPLPSIPDLDGILPAAGGAFAWAGVRSLLLAVGLRLAPELVVRTEEEARGAAARLTYPAVVKLLGPLHRTEVDGVRLGLADAAAVERAVRELAPRGDGCLIQPMVEGIEVLIGAVRDPALGSFVVVAPGGLHAELYGERAMRPAPVGADDVEGMLVEVPALDAMLRGYRGRPPRDRPALADAVARLSVLAARMGPRLGELDLNPVIVGAVGAGATVVDARIILESEPAANQSGGARLPTGEAGPRPPIPAPGRRPA